MNRFRNLPLVLSLMLLLTAAQLNLSSGNCCCDATTFTSDETAMSCHESEPTNKPANHCDSSPSVAADTNPAECTNCESDFSDIGNTIIADINCAGNCHNLESNSTLFIQPDIKPVISFLKTNTIDFIDKHSYLSTILSCQEVDINPPPRYLLFHVFLN